MKKENLIILPFLFLSILALLLGLWAGLVRLGWLLPYLSASLPVQHSPLMISGFLAMLIALERVAALRQRWMFAAPLLSGFGWVLSLILSGSSAGPLLITLGSLFTVGILLVIVKRETKIYTGSMAAGALCWLIGNIFWGLGMPIFQVVWWWVAFLVMTIAGERLELSRVMRYKNIYYQLFAVAAGSFLVGVLLYSTQPKLGAPVIGFGMLAV